MRPALSRRHMHLGDWLKPPRSILTFYLAGAAVALLCLTWLALRQLAQDELVEAQRARFRLEAIADRVVARLQQAVNEVERGLTTDVVDPKTGLIVVTVSPEHVQIRSGSLPFVPVAPESTQVSDSVFAAGDASEFAGAQPAKAAVVYRALAEQSTGATRAGALTRLARVLLARIGSTRRSRFTTVWPTCLPWSSTAGPPTSSHGGAAARRWRRPDGVPCW